MNQAISTNVTTKNSLFSNIRLFNKSVWLNLLSWFTLQFGYAGIFDVLMNLYLSRLGYGIDFIGVVNSAGGIGFAIFAIPAGLCGARWGYRRMLILGLLGGVLFPTLLALSQFIGPELQSSAIVLAYGLYSVSMTLIAVNGMTFLANAATDATRVHVFSVYATIAPLAGFCGSLAAGFLPKVIAGMTHTTLDQVIPYSIPLWIVPLLFLVFLFLFLFLTKGSKKMENQTSPLETKPVKEKAPKSLFVTMFTLTVLRISSFYALFIFFNIYLDNALKVSTDMIGIITSISRMIPIPFALLTPILVSKTGKFNVVLWVTLISAVFALPIALSANLWAGAVSFIVITGANAVASAAFTPLHQEATPEKWRSLMAGSVFSAEAVSLGLMAFVGGNIIKLLGYQPFFMVSAVTTFVSAFLFWLLLKNRVART